MVAPCVADKTIAAPRAKGTNRWPLPGEGGNKANGVPKGKGMEQWRLPTKCTYGIKYPSMKSATAAV